MSAEKTWAVLGKREGRVCKVGSTTHRANLFPSYDTGVYRVGHGLGRHLSFLDTFIFPESNSASDNARPRRGLFNTWKLERQKQVRLLLGVCCITVRAFSNLSAEKQERISSLSPHGTGELPLLWPKDLICQPGSLFSFSEYLPAHSSPPTWTCR